MSKNKLEKFAEMANFKNVIQPENPEYTLENYVLRGKWCKEFFGNNNPLTLELGCGKGEYTIGLSKLNKDINYIGVDIKGARIWRGAKTAIENNISNAGFLRTRIDMIKNYFGENEVSEIWITFPDPQPKKQNKRLTSAQFLNMYRLICKDDAIINLKTDSRLMHFYTRALLKANNIEPLMATDNLYENENISDVLKIRTFYESMFLNEGKKITYLRFKISKNKEIIEIPKFEEEF
ncbi:MAG: tRNA (guanosine(46)-N7)-methyltransferase TrmB [Bacteroidales bacterium]|nr:tRNA (guanosine(46)-N7)-methyltransferase TrmB [Bacteroidales bacterium]